MNNTPLTEEQKRLGDENAKLAYQILKYYPRLVERVGADEAVSAAGIALTRTLRSFDPGKGFRLSAMLNTAVMRQLVGDAERAERRARRVAATGRVYDRLTEPESRETAEGKAEREEEQEEAGRVVRRAMAKLKDKERWVLRLHYGLDGGDPLTLSEIGVALGVTGSRAQQIHAKAVARLREVIESV